MSDDSDDSEDNLLYAEPYSENCEPPRGPTFMPHMTIAPDGTPSYLVSEHGRGRVVRVTPEVFRDLVALWHASETSTLAEMFESLFEGNGDCNLTRALAFLIERLEAEAR